MWIPAYVYLYFTLCSQQDVEPTRVVTWYVSPSFVRCSRHADKKAITAASNTMNVANRNLPIYLWFPYIAKPHAFDTIRSACRCLFWFTSDVPVRWRLVSAEIIGPKTIFITVQNTRTNRLIYNETYYIYIMLLCLRRCVIVYIIVGHSAFRVARVRFRSECLTIIHCRLCRFILVSDFYRKFSVHYLLNPKIQKIEINYKRFIRWWQYWKCKKTLFQFITETELHFLTFHRFSFLFFFYFAHSG